MRTARPSPIADAPALQLERHRLSNGVEVVLQRAPPTSTTFAFSWLGEGGSAFDPEGREGAASVAARLLSAGTRRRDKRAFARELDRLASSFSSRSSWERLEVEASGPKEAEEELLELSREALEEPRFDEGELQRVRREMKEALWRERTQPDERADRAFLETLLPAGHPYRRNPLGSPRSLPRLTREEVGRFHRRHLSPRSARAVLTTHAPFPQALRRLEKTFGGLDGRSPTPPPRVPPVRSPARPAGALTYLSVAGSVQVEVVIGGPAPPRHHPDYPALFLAHEVLGGRPILSRLFQVVREQEGLAYGAGSELESLAWDGLWTADAGTDAKHVRRVHQLLLQEVRALSTHGPSAAELDLIRESYLGSLPLLLETATQAHSLAVEVAYFDLPLDHFRSWPTVLRGLTRSDLQRACERHLWPPHGPLGIAAGPPEGDPKRRA